MSTKLLFSCIFLLMFLTIESNPGLQARITQVGLDYANDVAIGIVTKELISKKIPDVNGEAGDVTYSVSNIQITSFTKPVSSITLAPPSGLTWEAKLIGLSIKGNFHYDYKKWIPISDSGSIEAKVGNADFNIKLLIDAEDGKPTIKQGGCSSSIANVDVRFRGGMSWIYNLFSGRVANTLQRSLDNQAIYVLLKTYDCTSQLCDILKNLVDTNAREALEKLKVMVDIGKQFTLDYRLVKPPVFTTKFLETYHKGEVFWKESRKEVPFVAPVFPPVASSTKMFYLWLSDYLVNTLMYQAQTHNILTYNLNSQDLPAGNRDVLNTTCDPGPCIGSLNPALEKEYPGCQVGLNMWSTRVPMFTIGSGQVNMAAWGDVNIYAVCPKSKAPTFLFTMSVNSAASIQLKLEKDKIRGKLTDMTIDMDVTKPTIKDVTKKSLDLLALAIRMFVMEKLNDLGSAGFPLPVTDNIKLVNPELKLANNTLFIATDIQYIV